LSKGVSAFFSATTGSFHGSIASLYGSIDRFNGILFTFIVSSVLRYVSIKFITRASQWLLRVTLLVSRIYEAS
jgi:hypothetical protein